MKKLLHILFSILILVLFSCDNGKIDKKSTQNLSDSTTKNKGKSIYYSKMKVLKSVYVIERQGIEIKQEADEDSKTLGTYKYAQHLEVIEDNEKWLGVRERNTSKVYVLKRQTGTIDDVILTPSNLNRIFSVTIDGQTGEAVAHLDNNERLKNYLTLELIDQQLFDSKKNTSVEFLLADTTIIKKKNRTIQLKCQKKVVTYIDAPEGSMDIRHFDYVGQVPIFNAYLIRGGYYERSNYKFIDKISGKETQTFVNYPNISTNKKHIICIHANPYGRSADLQLFSIRGTQIRLIATLSFINWMPKMNQEDKLGRSEVFWSNDGYLYVRANHSNAFWGEDGGYNKKSQYIRIKVL